MSSFPPDLSCPSNQKFLFGWVFQFVKMPGVMTICYCRKPLGILMVLQHKKFYYFFKEIHNYKTELSLSESNNGIMNSAVRLQNVL
jgi:hypothetical protein